MDFQMLIMSVKELGGIIEVQSEKENTIFTVYLPKEQRGEEKC